MPTVMQIEGLPYVTQGTDLTGTSATAVYTATGNVFANAVHLRIGNDGAGAATATVEWYDDSASASYVWIYQKSIAQNDALDLDLQGLRLDANDEIRVTAGTANYLHAIITVAEFAGKNG